MRVLVWVYFVLFLLMFRRSGLILQSSMHQDVVSLEQAARDAQELFDRGLQESSLLEQKTSDSTGMGLLGPLRTSGDFDFNNLVRAAGEPPAQTQSTSSTTSTYTSFSHQQLQPRPRPISCSTSFSGQPVRYHFFNSSLSSASSSQSCPKLCLNKSMNSPLPSTSCVSS